MTHIPVTLEQRQADYARAEQRANRAAEAWTEARAAGRMTPTLEQRMDNAQAELRHMARRLEQTQRQHARRAAA